LGSANRVDAARKHPLLALKIICLMPSIPRHPLHRGELSVKLFKILYEPVNFIPRFIE